MEFAKVTFELGEDPFSNRTSEVFSLLRSRNFLEQDGYDYLMHFRLTGEGLWEAERIAKIRKPKTISEWLADEKFQKIGNLSISVLSALISLGALGVAFAAYLKVD